MWCTDCVGHLQVQCGVVFGTQILASHTFKPRTSVYSKNMAIDSAFVCPLYRGRVTFDYRVLHIVAFFTFAALSQCCFYSLSAYLVMHIVDLYLYQWPPILYYFSGALLILYWLSIYYYSSSYISYSFSLACRCRVFQFVNLSTVPLQGALILYIQFSIQCISFSTRWSYTVDALCIAVASIYISISGTAALRFSAAHSVFLQAPIILHKYQFYSFSKSIRELFANSLLFNPMPQI